MSSLENKWNIFYTKVENYCDEHNKNLPTISTDGLRIKELYDLNTKEFNLKEEEGIVSRVEKI